MNERMNLFNGTGDVFRLFSDISNSNERHVVNNNLGVLWKEKVIDYTILSFKLSKLQNPQNSQAGCNVFPHTATSNQQTTQHNLLIQTTTNETLS